VTKKLLFKNLTGFILEVAYCSIKHPVKM